MEHEEPADIFLKSVRVHLLQYNKMSFSPLITSFKYKHTDASVNNLK